MKAKIFGSVIFLAAMTLFIMTTHQPVFSQSKLDCNLCHHLVVQQWLSGSHAHTQMDVADELAEERTGQSPDTVIHGPDAENCIACHSPLAVTVNGGMTEEKALEHFFTTSNGVFTNTTAAADIANWPHNGCTTCHNVPSDHPGSMPAFGYFNSSTTTYESVADVPSLCGRCHGNLRFKETDHLTYNAWGLSKHALTQDDVADELAEERTGQSPDAVVTGADAENCIGCHSPTAVLANGGMTEEEALGYFFSTENGAFSSSTVSRHKSEWPDVSCISCHNPHDPGKYSYFNSSTKEYEVMDNSADLCGRCHGNLRFPDTDHLSYNIEKGIGAAGVQYKETMPGVTCTDCHMYSSTVDGSHSAMYHGHSWSIFVTESDGSETSSCQKCHQSMDASTSRGNIKQFQEEVQIRLKRAEQKVKAADGVMQGNTDADLQAELDEAKTNLSLVESDESGGFHNHKYQMALLADVIQKTNDILSITPVTFAKSRAVLVATVTEDGMPVADLEVAFSRSVSGRRPDYKWKGTTDAEGQVKIEIVANTPQYWRVGASGYYRAKATNFSGDIVGEWGSIPIKGGREIAVSLPIGGKASVDGTGEALKFALDGALPNPFNPSTQIAYEIPKDGDVELAVYNTLGQKVAVLVRSNQAAGRYRVTWDGTDDYGNKVSSGIYIYRLVSQGNVATGRMLLVK